MRMVGRAGDAVFSKFDGVPPYTLLAGANSDTNRVRLFDNPDESNVFTQVSPGFDPTLSSLEVTTVSGRWFPNGSGVAIANSSATAGLSVMLYSYDGNDFANNIDSDAIAGSAGASDLAMRPQGDIISVSKAITGTNRLENFSFNGASCTLLSAPATLPGNTCRKVKWSPDGTKLAVGHDASPFFTVYHYNGSTFTKIANPATLPIGAVWGFAWANNNTLLLGARGDGSTTDGKIYAYAVTDTTLTKMADIPNDSTGFGNCVGGSASVDGSLIAFMQTSASASQRIRAYNTLGVDPFTEIDTSELTLSPTTYNGDPSWSLDNKYLAIPVSGASNQLLIAHYDPLTNKLLNAGTVPNLGDMGSCNFAQFRFGSA